MVRFKTLGTFEVLKGDKVCTPTAPKVRQVLALLLMHANFVVPTETIIQELWGDRPPSSAVTTAQTYIYQLRKIIENQNLARPGEELLVTKAPGYVLRIEPGQLDAEEFSKLVNESRGLLDRGAVGQAAGRLRDALNLWTGQALSNVPLGSRLEAYAVQLEEQRLRALELRIEAELQLGHHRELIGELQSLVKAHPFNEWFHARLMWTLSKSGRRNEALEVYRNLRDVLARELGLEPSQELQRLHHEVLSEGAPTAVRLVPQSLSA